MPSGRFITQRLILALCLLPTLALAMDGAVTTVADGDTFTLCAGNDCERIRLCGIDAPERGDPGSVAATEALRSMTRDQIVTCVPVGEGTVCNGRSRRRNGNRLVAQCFVGGKDIAAELVRQGLACDWVSFSGGHYGRVSGGAPCPPR